MKSPIKARTNLHAPVSFHKAEDKPVGQEIVKLLEEQKKEKPKDITIETEKYKAVINTDGARIISWKLKNFFLTNDYENVPWKMSFWNRVGNSYKNYFLGLTGSGADKEKRDNIDLSQCIRFSQCALFTAYERELYRRRL